MHPLQYHKLKWSQFQLDIIDLPIFRTVNRQCSGITVEKFKGLAAIQLHLNVFGFKFGMRDVISHYNFIIEENA